MPGNDVDRQIQKVVQHIKKHGYEVVFKEPTAEEKSKYARLIYLRQMGNGYNAQRTPASLPIVQKIYKALQQTHPSVLLIPTMGGSLPLYVFEKDLKTFPVTVSITNFDSNQHGENENIQLKYLWDGVESIAAILMIE